MLNALPLVSLLVAVVVLAASLLTAAQIGRQIARASVAGHVPGAGSHADGGRVGDGKSTTDSANVDRSARLLRMKRDLLEQWAREGKTIDIVTEARAELVALEVDERASAWRDYTAAAIDEPLEPERPFAS